VSFAVESFGGSVELVAREECVELRIERRRVLTLGDTTQNADGWHVSIQVHEPAIWFDGGGDLQAFERQVIYEPRVAMQQLEPLLKRLQLNEVGAGTYSSRYEVALDGCTVAAIEAADGLPIRSRVTVFDLTPGAWPTAFDAVIRIPLPGAHGSTATSAQLRGPSL